MMGWPGICSARCSTAAWSVSAPSRLRAARRAAFSPATPFDRCIASVPAHAATSPCRAWASNGRFANQLFQYAYVKLYALRHGVTAAIPAWQGQQLFDLDDPTCAGLALPELRFNAFIDDDRPLWDERRPADRH